MIRTLLLSLMMSFTLTEICAQSKTITGRVSEDATGALLPGVSVKVKGTTTGTITDANGYFSLTIPSGNSIVIFSQVGQQVTEVVVGTQDEINVQLKPDYRQLNEVVVNAIGIETQRDKFASSVSTVKGKDIGYVSSLFFFCRSTTLSDAIKLNLIIFYFADFQYVKIRKRYNIGTTICDLIRFYMISFDTQSAFLA